jgi:hypothetical protein
MKTLAEGERLITLKINEDDLFWLAIQEAKVPENADKSPKELIQLGLNHLFGIKSN